MEELVGILVPIAVEGLGFIEEAAGLLARSIEVRIQVVLGVDGTVVVIQGGVLDVPEVVFSEELPGVEDELRVTLVEVLPSITGRQYDGLTG